jgi:hypothetical protein
MAAEIKNFHSLNDLKRSGIDPNIEDPVSKDRPLFVAIDKDATPSIRHFLTKGADVFIEHRTKRMNALYYAVHKGNINAVNMFLERLPHAGVLDELQGPERRTLMMEAANGGYREICELLHRRGANVNIECENGDAAIDFASRQNFVPIVQFLEARGSRPPRNNPAPPRREVSPRRKSPIRRRVVSLCRKSPIAQPPRARMRASIEKLDELRTLLQHALDGEDDLHEILNILDANRHDNTQIQLKFGQQTFTYIFTVHQDEKTIRMYNDAVKRCVAEKTLGDNSTCLSFINGVKFKESDVQDMTLRLERDNKYLVVLWNDEPVFDEYEYKFPTIKYSSELPDEFKCIVCYEPWNTPCVNSCGNIYCKECLEGMIAKNMADPLTREKMSNKFIEVKAVTRIMGKWRIT